jgi:hypothetical protein
MSRPHASPSPSAADLSAEPHAAEPSASPAACTPARGPRRRPVSAVPVDAELIWVTAVPTHELAAARASSPAALVHLRLQLARSQAAASGAAPEAALAEAELVDAAARAVAGYLDDLPELPFVGEPFGGEEGTD